MDKNKKDTLFDVVFSIWFLGSIIGMFYLFGIEHVYLGLTLFLQLFIGLGVYFCSKSKIRILIILFGLSLLAVIWIDAFGNNILKNILTKEVLGSILGTLVFSIGGICMLVIPRNTEKKKLERCTIPVTAECIDLKVTYGDGSNLYSPVWKYYYNGEYHTYCDNFYSNIGIPKIGDNKELLLNPENLNDIYIQTPSIIRKIFDLLGIASLFFGLMSIQFFIAEIL